MSEALPQDLFGGPRIARAQVGKGKRQAVPFVLWILLSRPCEDVDRFFRTAKVRVDVSEQRQHGVVIQS